MRKLESLSERITPRLLLLLAVGGALLMMTPQRAGADPNNANCKPNRAGCTANPQCCSGFCDTTVALCATPPTTTSTTTTSTTTTSTTTTSTTTTSTTTTSSTTTSTTTTTTSSTTTTTLRFVDNGDGTVTDNDTGLQWEKKDNTCPGIHCVTDHYLWSNSGTAPDGPAFTSFLATLNNCASPDGTAVTNAGFAGHCDWRLPTIQELQSILDMSAPGCGSGNPCIDPTFGTTSTGGPWSSTAVTGSPSDAWYVLFGTGVVNFDPKVANDLVRAVRGGS